MRIRSIRPEFWSSEDIAAMDWHTRLVYIGLWSYVDDNGVGRDNDRLITTALFPLDESLPESSRRVTGALRYLSDHSHITRFEVGGKRFLHIDKWTTHQRIEKASKGRYPLPTCDDAEFPEPSRNTPGALPDMSALGEGEKGRRGEGISCASADAEREFTEWYANYPRKRGKGQAEKAYRLARKKASAEILLQTIRQQIPALVAKGPEFAPYPATWLNGQRWLDEPDAAVHQLHPRVDPDAWMRRRPQ